MSARPTAVLSRSGAGSSHRGRDRGLRHADRRPLDGQRGRCRARRLLALSGAVAALLAAGCAIETAPPTRPYDRPSWHRSAVTVCAAPELEAVTLAAAAAWYVGPELVYVGPCGEADVVVLPGGPWKGEHGEDMAAQTVMTFWTETGEMTLAEVFVAPEANGWDRQSIVTHELGHAIGLDDTDVSSATMFRWIGPYDIGARDIDREDERMVRALYGEENRR